MQAPRRDANNSYQSSYKIAKKGYEKRAYIFIINKNALISLPYAKIDQILFGLRRIFILPQLL